MPGVVAEQHGECALRYALQCARQTAHFGEGGLADVFDAGQIEGVRTAGNGYMFVEQQTPVHELLRLDDAFHLSSPGSRTVLITIDAIVVIAEYGIHTIGGFQAVKGANEGANFVGRGVDEVARKHNEVGTAGIDAVNQAFHKAGIGAVSAEMEVGYLHNAIALERRGNTAYL